jgi:hypothetical protein
MMFTKLFKKIWQITLLTEIIPGQTDAQRLFTVPSMDVKGKGEDGNVADKSDSRVQPNKF